MPVITSDFCLWIDAFEQFRGRFVIRVLRYKFAMNGKVKNLTLGLLNGGLQVIFTSFYDVNQREPMLNFFQDSLLFTNWW